MPSTTPTLTPIGETSAEGTAAPACPKHMVYGPCGGVGFDGTCEISPLTAAAGVAGPGVCPFVDRPALAWVGIRPASPVPPAQEAAPLPTPAPSTAAAQMRALIASRPVVLIDFPASALSVESIRTCADILHGYADAVLAGDHGGSRVQFPPAYRAMLIREAGLRPWMGFNNRDRNRVALEAELAALAHAGAVGVHCITGDHTLTGSRPDAAPVFDLDSTQTAALAHAWGHLVSVAESPSAPPTGERAARLLAKHRAGAEVCLVNHAGGAEPVAAFVARARALGAEMGYVPCLPVILDEHSADLLRTFPTLVLPPGYAESIVSAADPRSAGIDAAVELARRFLEIDGVVGIDLSGGPAPGEEIAYAEAVAEISDRLGVR